MSSTIATPAIRLEPAYDDPTAVLASIRAIDEWWPLARYAASAEEMAAAGGGATTKAYVPPWFRCDVALDGAALVPGADRILGNPGFVDAAHRIFGADADVAPTAVYVNVMLPSAVPFIPHVDVPAFRGVTRADHPVWLLKVMLESGLFEPWRITLATAVSWFYDGPGGAFHYWPEGPDRPPDVVEPPFGNVAVVADNERTYHGVESVGGDPEAVVRGLTFDSWLHRIDGGWEMREGDSVIGSAADAETRVTVSWKAEVVPAGVEAPADDLTLDRVVDVLLADLARRGLDAAAPDDPHHDRGWVRRLTEAYAIPPPPIPG